MMSLYTIGLSALNSAQLGLTTTAHNISNASNPDYHRQQISQTTQEPQPLGSGFVGNGTYVDNINRAYNRFLESQVAEVAGNASFQTTYFESVSQIDSILADPNAGLSPSIQDFFKGMSQVAADPASVPARQVLLNSTQALVNRFQSIDKRLEDLYNGANENIAGTVGTINALSEQIANLNQRIIVAESSTGNKIANDLHDQRESLIGQLNKLAKANVVVDSSGNYNVSIGNGQGVVVGPNFATLKTAQSAEDPRRTDVFFNLGAAAVLIGTDSLDGGALGGLLKFRDGIVSEARNAIGKIAIGLATDFNIQHKLGQDLTGQAGKDFFAVAAPIVRSNTGNAGSGAVSAALANPSALTSSDYRLYFDGTNYTLTRVNDKQTSTFTTFPQTIDGVTLDLAGAPAAGDSFYIQPTVQGSADLKGTITDVKQIAAAAQVRSAAAAANTGSGKISAGITTSPLDKLSFVFTSGATFDVVDNTSGTTLSSGNGYSSGANIDVNGFRFQISGISAAGDVFVVENLASKKLVSGVGSNTTANTPIPIPPATTFAPDTSNLTNPVSISFTSATTYDVTGSGPGLPATGLTYTAGAGITFNGWAVVLSGQPATGDTFTVGANSNGVADGRNAILLGGLATAKLFESGNATLQNTYSQLVSRVGNETNEAKVTSQAQDTLLANVTATQQGFSGVNLDEEAANLLRYQQAYQAASKILQASKEMLDQIFSIMQ